MKFQSIMKNNHGFMLPFSLLLLFLFSLIILQTAVKYDVEKQFFKNIKITYQLETLLHMAYRELSGMHENGNLADQGELHYDAGSVKYKLSEKPEGGLVVQLECFSNQAGKLFIELPFGNGLSRMDSIQF